MQVNWNAYVQGFNEGAVLEKPSIGKDHPFWHSYVKGWNSVVLDFKLKN